jgi:hypothetical protein
LWGLFRAVPVVARGRLFPLSAGELTGLDAGALIRTGDLSAREGRGIGVECGESAASAKPAPMTQEEVDEDEDIDPADPPF